MQEDGKTGEGGKRIFLGRRVLEWLVAGIILPLLAAALLPAFGPRRPRPSPIVLAKLQMANIEGATLSYETEYGRLPTGAETARDQQRDFTFGAAGTGCPIPVQNPGHGRQANNSEVMAILMDLTSFRNGKATVNSDHSRNPKRIPFLDAKQVQGNQFPGIGEDGVYRDPWGNPYIITLDLNHDGFCDDPLYGKVKRKVFVWSFGPDGKADLNLKPNEGVNQDNVTTAP